MDLSLGLYSVYFEPVYYHLGIEITLWQWEGSLTDTPSYNPNDDFVDYLANPDYEIRIT